MAGIRSWIMIFLTTTFTVVLACNPSTMLGVDAAPISGESCTTDQNCPLNKFCNMATLHKDKFCSPCMKCEKWNRNPKTEFSCAKKQYDCGDCMEGYIDVHEHCEANKQPQKEIGNNGYGHKNVSASMGLAEDNSTDKIWLTPLIIIIVTSIILISLGCVLKWDRVKKLMPKRRDFEPDHELDVLTPACGPSAPPVSEYSQQDPYNIMVPCSLPPPSSLPKLVIVQENGCPNMPDLIRVVGRGTVETASPFNAGNGAGDWGVDAIDAPVGGDAEPQPEHQQHVGADNPGDEQMMDEIVEAEAENDMEEEEEGVDEDDVVNVLEAEGQALLGGNFHEVPGLLPRRHISSFNPSDTVMDIPALLNNSSINGSHNSSVLSVTDSGTGTGPEDDNSMDASMFRSAFAVAAPVPDIDNANPAVVNALDLEDYLDYDLEDNFEE